jgi:anthranilate 1,2-dioxygenase small subunit
VARTIRTDAPLRAELRDLYDDYAAVLDAEDLASLPGFFTEDALYQVISRENLDAGLAHAPIYCHGAAMIRDRVTATRQSALYQPRSLRHFISGVRALGEAGGEIQATANFLVIESLIERMPEILMVGRYCDRLVRIDGALRFRERSCVYDNYQIRTTLVIPV